MQERKFGIDLKSYDDIFKTSEEREEDKLSKIRDIPISEIDDFPDHPFMVRDDEDMQNLIESIKERGVITPAMVRSIAELVRKNFSLSPTGIIRSLDLRRPIYKQTAAYGHMGRTDIDVPWEHTDKAAALREQAGI